MNKGIKFFKPKDGWENAKLIRMLEPKEYHTHLMTHHNDILLRYGVKSMLCIGKICPVCQILKENKKNVIVRLSIFLQTIYDAFKKLFR